MAAIIDIISISGTILSSLASVYFLSHTEDLIIQIYNIWAVCCLFSINAIFNHLKQFTILKRLLDILYYALKTTYPFLLVILINYSIFAVLGISLFGGVISSSAPEEFKIHAEADIDPDYVYLNWNDFLNSCVYLYALTLNNNLINLIGFSTIDSGKERDFRGIYFLVFQVLNNMILFNLFIGMIIGISLEYFQGVLEEKKWDDKFESFIDLNRRSVNNQSLIL